MCVAFCAKAEDLTASVPVVVNGKIQATLETQVYGLAYEGHKSIVVLSHGSSGGHPEQSIDWSTEANYFTQKGYVVLGFMRRGRGKSTGTSLESEEKNCDLKSWSPGLQGAFQDLDAIIEYAQSLPAVDARHLTLIGMSRGGFLSIAYAADGKHRDSVGAVVNFVGGWVAQAEDQCPADFNEASFRTYGAKVKVPTLWLYGAGDRFYGDDAVKRYATAFGRAGGKSEFHLIDGVPENGHGLPQHRELWKQFVDAFLDANAHRTSSKARK